MLVYKETQGISTARKHELVGYALYQAGQPIAACQSNDQRKGWMSALRDEADAETAAYLSMAVR